MKGAGHQKPIRSEYRYQSKARAKEREILSVGAGLVDTGAHLGSPQAAGGPADASLRTALCSKSSGPAARCHILRPGEQQ